MKKFMLILALLLGGAAHAGEVSGQTIGPLSSSGCVRANLLGANISTLTANVTWGAGVGTLTFSVSTDKAVTYTTIPTTRTSTPTMTAGGLAEFKVAGYTDLKACYVGSLTPVTLTFYGNGGILAFSPSNPGAIGGTTPAAGTFTTLKATVSEDFTAAPVGVTSGGSGTATGGITTAALAAPVMNAALGACTATTACTGGLFVHSSTIYFTVTATNPAGETLSATECSKATAACGNADTSTISIGWTAVPGAVAYNVYYGGSGAETKETAAIGTTGTTYTSTGSARSGALPTRNSTADEVHVGIAGTGTSTTAALPTTCTNGQQVYDTTASVVKVCASNTWTAIGAGTVTSVAQTAPGEFTVGGSPVTGTGTLALSYTATQTAGGVVYGDGTKRVVTPAGTTGQALLSNGASAPAFGTVPVAGGGTGSTAGGFTGPYTPDITTMRCGGADFARSGSTWVFVIPAVAQTENGTKSFATAQDTAAPHPGNAIQYVSAGTTGSPAGVTFNAAEVNISGHRAVYDVSSEGTATRRIWATQASAAFASNSHAVPTTSTPYVTAKYVGAAYDAAVGPDWYIVSGDGTNESGIDSGIPYVANRTFVVDIDCSQCSAGTLRVGINTTSGGALTYFTKGPSQQVPTASNFGTQVFAETRANSAVTFQMRGYSVCNYN